MTQTAEPGRETADTPHDFVRVSVVAGERRADLALPGTLAVAELVPELARALGVLDPGTVYAGYRLVTAEGRALSSGAGLLVQGVQDGNVLNLAAGVDDVAPRVYDDIVEAMADTVERDLDPWDPATGRRTALTVAALLLGLGALSLGLQRPDVVAGATAGVAAVVLLAAGFVLDRLRGEQEAALMLSWAGVVYAVVCGLTAAPEGDLLGLPTALGGLGAFVAGGAAFLGLQERRTALIPAIAGGAGFGIAGGIVAATSYDGAAVLTVLLVVVVIGGSLLPWAAIGSTDSRVDQPQTTEELTGEVTAVDADAVRRDARVGHEILLAVTVTVGLVVVLVAPLAVRLGVTGALVALAAGLVLLLRTRQYRVGTEVAVGLGAGVAGIVALCLGVVVQHESWLPVLAIALAVTSVVLLVFTLVPMSPSVRWGRLGDVAEVVALVAMLPLLVFAIGLVGVVTR